MSAIKLSKQEIVSRSCACKSHEHLTLTLAKLIMLRKNILHRVVCITHQTVRAYQSILAGRNTHTFANCFQYSLFGKLFCKNYRIVPGIKGKRLSGCSV